MAERALFENDGWDDFKVDLRERDEILERMGGAFERFNALDLVNYFGAKFHETFGWRPKFSAQRVKERSIMMGFLARYGKDAGPIIQYVFRRNDGLYERNPISISMFSTGFQWLQEKWFNEMKSLEAAYGSPR